MIVQSAPWSKVNPKNMVQRHSLWNGFHMLKCWFSNSLYFHEIQLAAKGDDHDFPQKCGLHRHDQKCIKMTVSLRNPTWYTTCVQLFSWAGSPVDYGIANNKGKSPNSGELWPCKSHWKVSMCILSGPNTYQFPSWKYRPKRTPKRKPERLRSAGGNFVSFRAGSTKLHHGSFPGFSLTCSNPMQVVKELAKSLPKKNVLCWIQCGQVKFENGAAQRQFGHLKEKNIPSNGGKNPPNPLVADNPPPFFPKNLSHKTRKKPTKKVPSLKLTANAPENGWLEYTIVSFWDGLFSGANC